MANIALIFLASFLFSLANPGFIFVNGFSLFAWIYYVPVFFVINRTSFKKAFLYGGLYGALSFSLYIYWMALRSYTAGFLFVVTAYFFYYAVAFILLKAANKFVPKFSWVVQTLILVFAEYFRTTGFFGVNYGVTGYTQWRHPIILAVARIGGVWLVSALVILCSAVIFKILDNAFQILPPNFSIKQIKQNPSGKNEFAGAVFLAVKKNLIPVSVFAVLFAVSLIYGISVQKDWSGMESVRTVAVQNNTDPWIGGFAAYKSDVENLRSLTDKALAEDSNIKLVVWPETAVVPSVMLHYTQRRDRGRFEMIKSLLEYIDEKDAVFVFGNDHAVPNGTGDNDDYNAVLVFTPKKNTVPPKPEIYAKQHLVPFTEYFPWQKELPKIYEMLLDGDTHLWTPGNELTVFNAGGLSFSTPVCFEDTFGDGCRLMVLKGARALVNLSNDAWSKSHACQNQHLAMATLRCVENSVPAVRSTASGETCFINPNGKITARAKPFEMDYAIGDVPVLGENMPLTPYTKWGDFFPKACAVIAAALILFGIVKRLCF